MTVAIREYVASDAEQLHALYTTAFSAATSDLFRRRWQWEFEGPPAIQRFANLVVERDKRLVAHLGRLSVRLAVGDALVPAVYMSDLMADPTGAGLSVLQLVKHCLKEVPVVLQFGGQPAAIQIYERLGMRHLPLGETLLRVERPSTALRTIAERRLAERPGLLRRLPRWLFGAVGSALTPACAIFYRWRARLPARTYGIATISDFDDRFDDLWAAMRRHCPVMCARDRAFLDWRYRQAPTGKYVVLALTGDDGSLAAASVLTQTKIGPAVCGRIMECLYRDEDALAALINASIATLRSRGVDLITSVGLSLRARQLLRRVGFRPFRDRPYMLRSNLGPENEDLLGDPARWYVSSGDGDEDFDRTVDAI